MSGSGAIAFAADNAPSVDKSDLGSKAGSKADDSDEVQDIDADVSEFSIGMSSEVEKTPLTRAPATHSDDDEVCIPVEEDNKSTELERATK